jgi:hypothetical protein
MHPDAPSRAKAIGSSVASPSDNESSTIHHFGASEITRLE